MAELLGLEEDLTCSICLSTFECPVTLPCGHNFCQQCVEASWAGGSVFCCPQCRASFSAKPELRKNTVLSTVVEALGSHRLPGSEAQGPAREKGRKEEEEAEEAVLCDTCMEAEAWQTCLTCMASYCQQHLQPHRVNPVFSQHQLSAPVGNLLEWVCKSHHKLLELFCSRHGQALCGMCLQQEHQGCPFTSTEEQRRLKTVSACARQP